MVKLNSYSNASGLFFFFFFFFFFYCWAMSCSVSTHTQTPLLSDKRSCKAFSDTNRIICNEREMLLKLNFFQLVERYRSWGSVLISIYRLHAHDLKKRKSAYKHATKRLKKRLRSSMNLALTVSTRMPKCSIFFQKESKLKFLVAIFGFCMKNAFNSLQTIGSGSGDS